MADPIKYSVNSTVVYKMKSNLVIKEYGIYDSHLKPIFQKNILQRIVDDSNNARASVIKKDIRIPKVHSIIFDVKSRAYGSDKTSSITVTEDYCGKTVFELNEGRLWINKVLKHIETFPEGIEIDTNPYNFTILNDQIFFVDFMPPKFMEYQNVVDMILFFPSVAKRSEESNKRRTWQYNTTDGRKQRFVYYLERDNFT